MNFVTTLKKIFSAYILPLVIILISTVLALLVTEFVLSRFTRLGAYEQWVGIKRGDINFFCYTSDPHNYYPYTLWDEELQQYVYCLTYDYKIKREGAFPDRPKSVALIGDSFVEGQGLREEDTLAYFMSQKYREYNFRNYGQGGAYIDQIMVRHEQIIEAYPKVKTIIYFYNLNDLMKSRKVHQRHKYIVDFENIFWRSAGEDRSQLPDYIKDSTLYHLWRKARILTHESKMTVRHYHECYFGEDNQEARNRSMDILLDMQRLAQEHDIKFYLVIYPLLYKDMWGRYPFVAIHQYIMDFCRMHGVACIDAYPAFEEYYSLKKFTVHEIDYHPSGLSNRTVVDYLAQHPDFILH